MDFNKYLKEGGRLAKRIRTVSSGNLKWPLVASLALLGIAVYVGFLRAPGEYPARIIFTVEEGDTVGAVATGLKEANIIKSPFLFKMVISMFDGDHGAKAGDYFLHKKQNVVVLAYRLATAAFGLEPVRFFVPEGLNVFQLADVVAKVFPEINREDFIKEAGPKEGYLFPDTYILPPNAKVKTIVKIMTDNFNTQIVSLNEEIAEFGRSPEDVIKMASIVEEEARRFETKQMIAGILWKRIDEGMPLQVDASFSYVNGKNTFELSLDDLNTDSPYNTYTNKGLPPTPIASPGLNSILATITPIESDYYFYLTDHDGEMRYAATHDQHVVNKDRYLR